MSKHKKVHISKEVRSGGFTFVEMAVVMVVIGLMVGGVLAAQDMVRNSKIQATINQANSIKTATAAFKEKYHFLPGDIPTANASAAGMSLRPSNSAAGDGNGLIALGAVGEPGLFFPHLSEAGLIPGRYQHVPINGDYSTAVSIGQYIMRSALDGNFYFNAWSGGPDAAHPGGSSPGVNGKNYIGLSGVTRYCDSAVCANWGGYNTFDTRDAYIIDSKIDDSLPQSGNVQAFFLAWGTYGQWAGAEYSSRGFHATNSHLPSTGANIKGLTNCYDNGGVAGTVQKYSYTPGSTVVCGVTTYGTTKNCAISFLLQ